MKQSQSHKLLSIFIPGVKDLVFAWFFYLVLLLGTAFFRDGDPGRHIIFGQYMMATGTLPTQDPFSYTTAGVYLPPYEWLSQVIFGAAHQWLGLAGVVAVCAFLIAGTIRLTYEEFLRRKVPVLVALGLTIWLGVLTMVHWAARPHLFSLFFLALLTPQLARMAEGEKIPYWHFALLLFIWVNTHGAAFVLVFLLWFAYIAGNLWDSVQKREPVWNPVLKRLCISGLVAFATTFLNPAGWRIWEFILGYMGNSYLIEIAGETRAVNVHEFNSYPVFLTILVSLWLLSISKTKRPMGENFMLVGWTALALYGWRNIPLYAIICMPILAEFGKEFFIQASWLVRPSRAIQELEKASTGNFWSTAISIIFVAMLALGVNFDIWKTGYHFNKQEFPSGAVSWLQKNPQSGPIFNYFPWGGYLIYTEWPKQQVFIDGQMIYIESLVKDYYRILNAERGWEEAAARYKIEWMLVPPTARIVQELEQSATWKILYRDETAVILRHQFQGVEP